MKIVGWILWVIGMAMVWDLTEGLWLPFIALVLIDVGEALKYGAD